MNKQVMLDPGHGGRDPGAVGPGGLYEKVCTLAIARRVKAWLDGHGIQTGMTREDDTYLTLDERADRANASGADYYVSIHINSAAATSARGTETYAFAAAGQGEQLAKAVQTALVREIGLADRGVKFANFAVLRKTKMPAALTEVCFISNAAEEALLRTETFLDNAARGIAQGILGFLGVAFDMSRDGQGKTPILSVPRVSQRQAALWAAQKGAGSLFVSHAALYWEVAQEIGVDPATAYAQYARETGYGRFDGVVDVSFHNPCGLKTAEGGSDMEPAAHARFTDWREGIQAHMDHLALYAGAAGYPRTAHATPDPRHFRYLFGTCKYVEELGGKWAPDAQYGHVLARMMEEMQMVKETPAGNTLPEKASSWAADAWSRAYAAGVLDGTGPQNPVTREQLAVVLDRLGLLPDAADEK